MKKSSQLHQLLTHDRPEFLLGANDAIAAKIAETAGFEGIWASGWAIAAQLGLPDQQPFSWQLVLQILELMADATTIPIVFDAARTECDPHQMPWLVQKLAQRGIAGVCFKEAFLPPGDRPTPPSTTSTAIAEFCTQLQASKVSADPEFVILVRVELGLTKTSVTEALKRARAYDKAGIDGIVIHSSHPSPDLLLAFKQTWGDRSPVVIIPTRVHGMPPEVLYRYRFALVVWEHQLLHHAATTMQRTAEILRRDRHLLNLATNLPLDSTTALPLNQPLSATPDPQTKSSSRVILLAATQDGDWGELTVDRPKWMIGAPDRPLLGRIVQTYQQLGLTEITVVRGYGKAAIDLPQIRYIDNDAYDRTGELVSLYLGVHELPQDGRDWLISQGDVLFKDYILQQLLEVKKDFVVVVDATARPQTYQAKPDFVTASQPYSDSRFRQPVYLQQIGGDLPAANICGLWTGLLKVSAKGQKPFSKALRSLLQSNTLQQFGRLPALLNHLIALKYPVHILYITDHWLEVDTIADMLKATHF
ncbi:isocitrate lyase/phosphoenolpyruvate mutase family protein [Pantanalinema rosaneae CENA516]|uniref:isocitrate lyase/phosphoenolpyruvate mutase family protein n=1 Tax=Pantanalinema rosaneae TaxID=1620701 RepID=UPI003D6F427E